MRQVSFTMKDPEAQLMVVMPLGMCSTNHDVLEHIRNTETHLVCHQTAFLLVDSSIICLSLFNKSQKTLKLNGNADTFNFNLITMFFC